MILLLRTFNIQNVSLRRTDNCFLYNTSSFSIVGIPLSSCHSLKEIEIQLLSTFAISATSFQLKYNVDIPKEVIIEGIQISNSGVAELIVKENFLIYNKVIKR